MQFQFTPLIAALLASASVVEASKSWTLTYNWKAGCGGDGYKDSGKLSTDCINIHLRDGVGDVSTKYTTNIDAGYCKVYLYDGQFCGGNVKEYTAYSTDGQGTGKGDVCLTGISVKSYKIYCTV
jgi:hypothetical protein